jgi:hypothetical protein
VIWTWTVPQRVCTASPVYVPEADPDDDDPDDDDPDDEDPDEADPDEVADVSAVPLPEEVVFCVPLLAATASELVLVW